MAVSWKSMNMKKTSYLKLGFCGINMASRNTLVVEFMFISGAFPCSLYYMEHYTEDDIKLYQGS